MAEYFRVKEAFAYGEHNVATPGQIWSSDNPNLKGREHLFEPVEVAAARAVGATETATAGPGEARSRSKRLGGHRPSEPTESSAETEAPATPAEQE